MGYGRDLVDAVQLLEQYLKDVGIEVELKQQEYGAYHGDNVPGQVRGYGHRALLALPGNRIACCMACMSLTTCATAAMSTTRSSWPCCKEQRRTKDLEARKQLIFDIQRYIAAQQYYVFTVSIA